MRLPRVTTAELDLLSLQEIKEIKGFQETRDLNEFWGLLRREIKLLIGLQVQLVLV